jgi:hypothetical protein
MIQRHLVAVWNPSVAADIMDAHIGVLLDMVRRAKERKAGDDEIYVWWGKVRSANRQRPLPHLPEVISLDDHVPDDDEAGGEMHLYLTDYRSLYVGHLGGVTTDEVQESDPDHVPAYYRERELRCDCWFQLWDLRRIVHDDTLGVVAELRKLRNTHYNDRPVSIYGGMVDLPLIVYREDDARFFSPAESEQVLDGRSWVEFDAQQTALGALERDLRENLLGDEVWSALDLGTRTFVASAERVFRANRANAAFDFAAVLGGFAKALEIECNARLRTGLRRTPAERRRANVEGRTVDLGARQHLSLGQLSRVLRDEREVILALNASLRNGTYFTGRLPYVLEGFRSVRNDGAHSVVIDRDTAIHWRNQLMGIGCQGVLVDLSKVAAL